MDLALLSQLTSHSLIRALSLRRTHAPERRADTEGRSVRVRGIKPGTEEAIVQQAFAKLASVRVVVMVAGSSEAVVELESVAVSPTLPSLRAAITIQS